MRGVVVGLATAATVLGGCSKRLDITNPNNPTQATAALNPRDASIRLIVGAIATFRGNRGDQINAFGSYGRETYNMSPQDGRSVTGPYRDWAQNSAFTAGTNWAGRYGNYRNIFAIFTLLAATPDGPITAVEKKGATGVLKTILALEMLGVVEARGIIGGVVDMSDDVNQVFPLVSQDSMYNWVTNKLDEAKADLDAAGGTFYFPMHTGFSAFGVAGNTPAGFGQFNRAIKARVEAKRASLGCGAPCYTAALTALSASFVSTLTAANRDDGIYVIFSTAAGDALNTISFATNSNLYVHKQIDQLPGAALDDRYRRKVDAHETSATEDDLCSLVYPSRSLVGGVADNRPCTYAGNTTPIPVVRNEELILTRAEAKWFTGDHAGAIADLDLVRVNSGATRGGTASVAFAAPGNDADFTSELLLQRTLSLFQEGFRWVDYRRFGRLTQLGTLPSDIAAGFTVATYSVLPQQECDARARAGAPVELSCPTP
jgi:starch-binding outer membrane protein, SusD/RagB family